VIGALSAVGVLGGVALANVLPQRALKIGFAALLVVVAAQFLRRYWRARQVPVAPSTAAGSDVDDPL
jgi:uncharacterized membrane protein YfcA